MSKQKPKWTPNPWRMYSWEPAKRAGLKRIREAIRHAGVEKKAVSVLDSKWYEGASHMSRQWVDEVRISSIHLLARKHLEYWRYRAFMPGAYGMPNTGDRPAHARWMEFA